MKVYAVALHLTIQDSNRTINSIKLDVVQAVSKEEALGKAVIDVTTNASVGAYKVREIVPLTDE